MASRNSAFSVFEDKDTTGFNLLSLNRILAVKSTGVFYRKIALSNAITVEEGLMDGSCVKIADDEIFSEIASKANADEVYLKSEIENFLLLKQDTLTAGNNIILDNNIISINENLGLSWDNITDKPEITVSGDISGYVSISEKSNTLNLNIQPNSIVLGTDTTGNFVSDVTAGSYIIKSGTAGEGWSPTIAVNAATANTASTIVARDASGNFSAGTITAALNGNAATATKLSEPITITFDGSISGSATFDGSTNISITTENISTSLLTDILNIDGEGSGLDADLLDGMNTSFSNTASTIVARDASGNFSAGTITAALNGNAATATKLETARTISLTGDVVGSVSFDGSANASISTTIQPNSIVLGTDTTGNFVSDVTAGSYIIKSGTAGEGWSPTIAVNAATANTASTIVARDASGNFSAGTITATRITGLSEPIITSDAVTKNYVDNLALGFKAAPQCRAATDSLLIAVYNNGTNGVGSRLTASANGSLIVDGETLLVNDGILVKNQNNLLENGRYTVFDAGSSSSPWIIERCYLCDESNEIPGKYVFVTDGIKNKNTSWVMTVDDVETFDVGVDNITVVQFSGEGSYTVSNDFILNGSYLELNPTGVSSGTYKSVTVDSNGRVTAGTNPSTIAGFGITDILVRSVSGTLPIVSSGGTSPTISINAATTSTAGSMSATDKVKLDASTSINTPNTIISRDASGNFSAGTISATLNGNASTSSTCSGNAATATKLETARTISLTGDVVGSVSFDGSANASISTTIQPNSIVLGTDTTGNFVSDVTAGSYIIKSGTAGEGWSPTIGVNAATANTASTIVARDASGNFSAGTITAALNGNAATATKLETARTISLTGEVSGSVSFDGSSNATITATISGDKVIAGNYVQTITPGTYITISGTPAASWTPTIAVNAYTTNTTNSIVARDASGNFSAGTISATLNGNASTSSTCSGNAATATKLETARTINGVSFDGSANITIADGTKQPLDADLTAIAALSGTSGFLRKSATDSWYLDTNNYVTSSGVTSVSGTLPIISSGGTTPTISINAATTSTAGSMSATDKAKLDGIAANANNYSLPAASSSNYGGIKVSLSGTTLTITV